MESEEYKKQKFVSQEHHQLRDKMLSAVTEVNRWKRAIVSKHDAELQAKLQYMKKKNGKFGYTILSYLLKKSTWKHFLRSYP